VEDVAVLTDVHTPRLHGHFVVDGADDHRCRAVGHRLTVDARLAVGTIGTRLAVRPRLPVRVLLVVGVRLAVRSRLPVRVIGSWLAVPDLAVSLRSEERRVGKACRSRWATGCHEQKLRLPAVAGRTSAASGQPEG